MAGTTAGPLLRRLLLGTLTPTVLALGLFGVVADQMARRTLEDELGRRLETAAVAVALGVFPAQLAAVDEGSDLYRNGVARLRHVRDALGVRRVLLVAPDGTARGDTDGLVALGAEAYELAADGAEQARARDGTPASSLLFAGRDGRPYKRAYAAVRAARASGDGTAGGGTGVVAGVVAVEGSADFFTALAAFRRWLLFGGGIALAAVVGVTVLVARRITGPVARLAAAAQRIGRGDLAAPVPAETRDEIGVLARTLDEMRGALHARDERMQMMLAGIAHEVRNPLGGLELYAGLLREALTGQPERLGEVARIQREVDYLEAVVADFLDYARRPAPELGPVPVAPLLQEVRELAAPPEGVAVSVEVADDVLVRADRNQLRRALLNLVKNAVAATPAGGRIVLAAARVEGGGGQRGQSDAGGAAGGAPAVRIEVRDSGPGVPPAERTKIFTPFYTTREKGTGLGLAFVHDIVREHGGDVSVDDAPGGGACFRVRLPAG